MKKNMLVFTVVIAVLINYGSLFAQNNETRTIEELYLQNVELQLVREQAVTVDRDVKLIALTGLQNLIDQGSLAEGDEEAHLILNYLSKEGIDNLVMENGRLINYWPEVRRQACQLLGNLGGENSKDTLIQVLLTDNEPMVLSEAVYALGKIGIDDEGDTYKAIYRALNTQDPTRPDDNFAFASLLALEKLIDQNGPSNDRNLFQALVSIQTNSRYVKPVRDKATVVVNMLREANR